MKIHTEQFRVPEGKKLKLGKWPTKVKRVYRSKDDYRRILQAHVARLDALQQLLYASNQFVPSHVG